jgi:hypothetical protein
MYPGLPTTPWLHGAYDTRATLEPASEGFLEGLAMVNTWLPYLCRERVIQGDRWKGLSGCPVPMFYFTDEDTGI